MESQDSKDYQFDYSSHTFSIPQKRIDDMATLERFKKSEAC